MNNKIFEFFLNGYKYDEKDSNEFDFKFNLKSEVDEFNKEFNKLIHMFDFFYYENEKLVTSFNSCDVIIPKKILKHIISLYNYADIHKFYCQKGIISDFLFTYYKTILKNEKEQKKYKKVKEEYKKVMNESGLRLFYNKLINDSSSFYISAITYGVKNDFLIRTNIISKIMNNITDRNIRQKIIEKTLKRDNYIFVDIKYDTELQKHKQRYFRFIKQIISQECNYYNANELIIPLIKKDILDDNNIKKIINIYVKKTNAICDKYKNRSDGFISEISDIDALRKCYLELLNINTLAKKYKEKIRECLVNILSLKRIILSDDNRINSELHEYSTETSISNKKIKLFIKELEESAFRIYSASNIDFDKTMEETINFYSKYALLSMVSRYSIDSKNQIYYNEDSFLHRNSYFFINYYEKLGKEYTNINKLNLMNIMNNNYYIEMLKRLSSTFYMSQNLVISILGEEKFRETIEKLKRSYKYEINNDYSVVVSNILAIEINIYKILSKNSMKHYKNMVRNLDSLFKRYVDNKMIRNGIMYLYYTLYEYTGPNLRNKAMHGSLINNDLKIPLLVSFSGLIFSCWLLDE